MTIEQAIEIVTNAVQTEKYTAEQDKALAMVQKAVLNAVDIVRCKDCIYREQADSDYYDSGYCCAITKCDVGENDYCGQGERRNQ